LSGVGRGALPVHLLAKPCGFVEGGLTKQGLAGRARTKTLLGSTPSPIMSSFCGYGRIAAFVAHQFRRQQIR